MLYSKLVGVDTKAAYRELSSGEFSNHSYSSYESEMEPKPLLERHEVYSELLNMLLLSPIHKTNLLNRGLDISAIEQNKYRSIPDKAQAEYIAQTLSRRYDILGTPGFYTDNGKWRMALQEGMFIPVRDKDDYIQGFQIRLDNIKDRKYRWFSSRGREKGTKAYSWPHISNWKGIKAIFITEGALKADVAAHLSDDCFIGLSGVNCTDGLVPLLQSMNIKTVYECFDMDKNTNRNVGTAVTALKAKLQSIGIFCESMYWDKMTNGIDDYYLFSKWLDEKAA